MSKFDQGIAQTIRSWLATILPQHSDLLLSSQSFYDAMKSGLILCEYVIRRSTAAYSLKSCKPLPPRLHSCF